MIHLNYIEDINSYAPIIEQEEHDLEVMKRFITDFPDTCLSRENQYGHFSASAWVVNKERTKVLLNFHNIYKNWGWLGGHADSDDDLLNVALKEVHEESGLKNLKPVVDFPISIEILPVAYHMKRGKFVNSHLHFNLTYLIEADPDEKLTINPDENSGLMWVELDKAVELTNEECMKPIYEKLNLYVKNRCCKEINF